MTVDAPPILGEDLELAAYFVGDDRPVLDDVTAVAPLLVAEEPPVGDAPPDVPPLLMAELATAPAETSPPPLPPPPTGPRLASPEDIPPPPSPDGQPGGNGDGVGEQAEHVDIFELFGWPPGPARLDDDDVRSLHDTRPFPLPVGNATAVYDLRALQFLDSGVPPGPDGNTGTERPPTGPDLPSESAARRRLTAPFELGDRVFRGGAWAGGLSVLAIMVAVGLFLTVQAFPALRTRGFRFLTTAEWQPDAG